MHASNALKCTLAIKLRRELWLSTPQGPRKASAGRPLYPDRPEDKQTSTDHWLDLAAFRLQKLLPESGPRAVKQLRERLKQTWCFGVQRKMPCYPRDDWQGKASMFKSMPRDSLCGQCCWATWRHYRDVSEFPICDCGVKRHDGVIS